jgi:membrane protease YdiL (CAAX protease family)
MKKHPLVAYFTLAYALSWCVFVPLALSAQGLIPPLPGWIHFLGAFGPLLAAFIVSAASSGLGGLRDLLGRMLRWRVGWLWWPVALLSPGLLFLVSALILRLVTGAWPEFRSFGHIAEFPALPWWAGWIVWTLTFGLGEETGWRGFALPRLQNGRSARNATLILGLLWAGWHIPTFFYNYELSIISVVAFLVSILSGAVVFTWLYNSSGGSLLMVILWHGAFNTAVAGAEGVVSALVSAFIILAAILIGRRYGPETFSHSEKQTLA